MRLGPVVLHALGIGMIAVTTRTASADPAPTAAAACSEAHAEGQRAERRGELRSARARYGQCTAFECPAAVRRDCDELRVRVEQSIPSVIIRTKGAQSGSVAARVWVDDVLIPAAKTGLAIDVDPGPHRIRVEAEGFLRQEQSIVVVAAEKDRVVDIQLAPIAAAGSRPVPHAPPSPWPYVLGGVGLVGVGLFVGIAVDAGARYDTLDHSCAPRCSPDEVDGIRRSYVIADVALAVGGTALVASAVWLIARALSRDLPSATASPPRRRGDPAPSPLFAQPGSADTRPLW
jgi:hypothetical protein